MSHMYCGCAVDLTGRLFVRIIGLEVWWFGSCKISAIQCKGKFPNLELNGWGRQNVRLSTENWPYLRNGET